MPMSEALFKFSGCLFFGGLIVAFVADRLGLVPNNRGVYWGLMTATAGAGVAVLGILLMVLFGAQ
jgi:hypothetical protein